MLWDPALYPTQKLNCPNRTLSTESPTGCTHRINRLICKPTASLPGKVTQLPKVNDSRPASCILHICEIRLLQSNGSCRAGSA